jgi:hypothetical protein
MAAKRSIDKTPSIVLPTFGLVFFILLWSALCAAAFYWIYQGIVAKSDEPGVALSALQWMTWPFAVLAIAGPLLILLSIGGLRVVRDLLELQKLFSGLPQQVQSMQDALVEMRTLRTQIITDVSRVNDAAEGEAETLEVRDSAERPEVARFFQLYEKAKEIFYSALEDYNTEGAEPLIVQRGGMNFSEIATVLAEKRAFAKPEDRNRRLAEFVIKTFSLERSTRRNGRAGITPAAVQELIDLGAGF